MHRAARFACLFLTIGGCSSSSTEPAPDAPACTPVSVYGKPCTCTDGRSGTSDCSKGTLICLCSSDTGSDVSDGSDAADAD